MAHYGGTTRPLRRLLDTWALSAAEAAPCFSITPEALARWLRDDPPADQLPAIADLDAATASLERHLRREAIPAVVRRPAPFTDNRSLLEIAQSGDHAAVRDCADRMFDLRGGLEQAFLAARNESCRENAGQLRNALPDQD